MDVVEFDENAKLAKHIADNFASTNALSESKTQGLTGQTNDIVSLLSDSENEDINGNGRVDDAEPIIYFLNNEVTLEVLKPSIATNNNDSSVVMLDPSAEILKNVCQQSVDRTQNSQQPMKLQAEHSTRYTDTTSFAIPASNSIESNELQPQKSTDNVDKTTWTAHECINSHCLSIGETGTFCLAPLWALNYFNVARRFDRSQFICQNCFDASISDYERMCGALVNQQPLLLQQLPVRPEVVEIADSEEEDNGDGIVECEKPLSSATLSLLEDQLDVVMKETIDRLNMEKQVAWTNQILEHKLDTNAAISDTIDQQINPIQQLSTSMYKNLYESSKYLIEDLPPFDLNRNKKMRLYGPEYPPQGEVVYSPVDTHSLYYAVRTKLSSAWMSCKVIERIAGPVDGTTMFQVRFYRCKNDRYKTVSGNHLAYGTAPGVRLKLGTRVIALPLQSSTNTSRTTFSPGIIAETLQAYNHWRYLLFFDDGSARYVSPDNIRLVCSPSPNVWEDVHQDVATYIKSYLEQYQTDRPMVQVERGQKMITEWNSEWRNARVDDIDDSLVLMYFESMKRWEWIYRGSPRLGPMFKELHQLQKRSGIAVDGNITFVDVTIDDDDDEEKNCSETTEETTEEIVQPEKSPAANPADIPSTSQLSPEIVKEMRAVAKKSTMPLIQSRPAVHHNMNTATIYIDEDIRSKGKVVNYSVRNCTHPRKFDPHVCGASCLHDVKHDLSSYHPLAKPLLSGWERKVLNKKTKKVILYRTPCGRSLRNMHEVHVYLRATKCSLNADHFDFGVMTSCLAEYVVDSCYIKKKDLSDGREGMIVTVENLYDDTMPPPCVYSAERIPTEGVPLNLDANFLCGCDCDDDCWDKTKCQCWKLTLEGAQVISPYAPIDRMGYQFKRLTDAMPTGLYECNSQCKCSKACSNRVAQHPLQLKLQVFKTMSRGWGLRCLTDVPMGCFVCVYAGDLLTDKNANIAGSCYGDEYFADLDHIEIVENLKEGYEPEAIDECSTRNGVFASNANNVGESTTLKVEPAFNSDEDESQRLPSFDATSSQTSLPRSNSIFRFYDQNERVFTIDAMKRGNIGRYINHSCEPNLFVQNVYVDTHDLRFPWVAFFAKTHIRAGTELTWDYNYVVGSVTGKVLFCECGAANCRRRIL